MNNSSYTATALAAGMATGGEPVVFSEILETEFGKAELVGYIPALTVKVPAILMIAEDSPVSFKDGTSGKSGCQWPVTPICRRGYAAVAIDCSQLNGDYFDARTAAVKAAMDAFEKSDLVDAGKVAVIGMGKRGEAAARSAERDCRVKFAFVSCPVRDQSKVDPDLPKDVWNDYTEFDYVSCKAKCVIGYEMAGKSLRDFSSSPAKFWRYGGPQLTGYDWLEFMSFLDEQGWKVNLADVMKPREFKVMSWNMEGGSESDKEISSAAEIIRDSGADVVLIIENYGILPKLLKCLGAGWQGEQFSMSLALITRQRIVGVARPFYAKWNYLDGSGPFNFGMAEIDVAGQRVRCCPTWLDWEPAAGHASFEDGRDAMIKFAYSYPRFANRRIDEINGILKSISRYLEEVDDVPMVIGGDFNVDSDLDWTEETKDLPSHFGISIPWPESIAMREAGFADTFRMLNPDVRKSYGASWSSPKNWDENGKCTHRPERIDFIYYKGGKLTPTVSETVHCAWHRPFLWNGKKYESFPSDHGFVLTTFALKTPPPVNM